MEPNRSDCEVRLQAFLHDLGRPAQEIVQKHILTGVPAALTPDEYFSLRHEVAGHFCIHPVEVVLVGSCKTGFSLRDKPERGRPRYSFVEQGSDLDIVVVSERLFGEVWDAVFDYGCTSSAYRTSPEATQFRNMLFHGWMDPRGLPPGRNFALGDRWVQFFDGISRDRRFGNRRATARVYRDWSRVAAYQQIAVKQCQRAHKRQEK